MKETFKCPHGALYEITYKKTDADDNHAADCQVCVAETGIHRLKWQRLRIQTQ
jgi:hypothetical protein